MNPSPYRQGVQGIIFRAKNFPPSESVKPLFVLVGVLPLMGIMCFITLKLYFSWSRRSLQKYEQLIQQRTEHQGLR